MKKRIRNIVIAIFAGVLVLSSCMLVYEYVIRKKAESEFKDLAELLGDPTTAQEQISVEPQTGPGLSPILPQYEELYNKNKDTFGWIQIPDTTINYPVMHTPNDPNYYQERNFEGKHTVAGTLFMDGRCYYGCGNYIIYGHRMTNNTMFKGLISYQKKGFYENHPIVYFDTMWDTGKYEIIAAFYSRVYTDQDKDAFVYYDYTDLTDEDRFKEYIENIKTVNILDTDVEVEYGDQLITMSTCNYHTKNGRFAVVAKLVT